MATTEGKLSALPTSAKGGSQPLRAVGSQLFRTLHGKKQDSITQNSATAPLMLSPSRAELFDFRYLLGRSSARIALFEVEPLARGDASNRAALAERFWLSESRLVDANEKFFSAYQFANITECIGKPFEIFFPKNEQHKTLINSWYERGLVLGHFDLAADELDGSRSHFSAAMYAIDEQSIVTRFWIVLRDVTPLANALAAVSQQEEYYRGLAETSGFFMVRATALGQTVYVSPSLLELVGYPLGDFCANANLFHSIIHPDDVEHFEELSGNCSGDTYSPIEIEYRILTGDGTYRWMFERRTHSESGGDRSECFIDSLIFDIQERKLLEAELHHSQRMDMVGQLAGGVAHDFNNYLTVILGQIRLSLLELTRGSVTHERLLASEQAALRCADMTRQLLSLAHRDELVKRSVSVSQLVSSTASLCSHLLPPRICLNTEALLPSASAVLPTAGDLVAGDQGQLQQVLMNLVVNARDAIAGPGSISIRSSARDLETHDQVYGVPAGRYIEIIVADSGSGIAREHLAHIFEPFFTTKPSGQGTGLGLSLVYSIVRSHGGSVTVTSEVGTGTSFSVLLPITSSAPSQNAGLGSDPDTGRDTEDATRDERVESETSHEVLVVDDEQLVRSVIKASLLGSGYVVTEARTGKEALEILIQRPDRFGLIIVDQTMPGMSGKELVAEIRGRGNTVPLLLTTGLSGFEGAPDGVNDIHEIIIKPFDPIDLIGAAFRLCQRKK